ncbi:ABC-2 type transporter [Rippkaea orientalis PCC 8801]|uniref:Transport permease protein n=1 Tax=Rippkaea orientalis (strain PCC 8801 / RF-1) TaxID=41431 RepID=B7JXU2_RIPO1|nr:ABC transporter permease [Rippkaea orientalis]ACK65906.1 ABC-2 type transporter [Rippkaea orientalis PCC 8801]
MALSIKANAQWSPFKRYLELLHILVEQNLKGRYRGSFLGVYWSLLNPLIMTGLYAAIFGTAFAKFYGDSILNYVLAAFTGLIVINFFSASTTQALASIVGNGALLNKIRLPLTIFPVSMIVANIFQFVMGPLPLLAIVTLLMTKNPLNVLALVFPLIALSLVCTGVGFLVSALYVFFRDLPYFYELVCFVLWISSPVFYPPEIVPQSVQSFLFLNPLSPIIESIRYISGIDTTIAADIPVTIMNIVMIVGHSFFNGIILLMLGWICFRAWQNQFMDLL